MFESPVSTIANGIILINLAKIRGAQAVCARVPSQSGVYAWFQNHHPPSPATSTAEEFADYLIDQATREHCLPRRGRIPPLYALELRSAKQISPYKRDTLLTLCGSATFRSAMTTVLQSAIFFQQPLYVGKASHLPTRIRQHVEPGSVLRQRLETVGIDIERLLLICMPVDGLVADETEVQPDIEPNETDESLPTELVVEELFSKLFHPLFTARYG